MKHYLHDANRCPTAQRLLNDAPEGYVPNASTTTCKHCLKFIANHKEPTMTTIDLRKAPRQKKQSDNTFVFDIRLVIEGAENHSGYGLGAVPTGAEARQIMHGPMVAGPWAFSFGLATVIAGQYGTGAEMQREDAEGRLIRCKAGDTLILANDLRVVVELDRRGYPTLRNITCSECGETQRLRYPGGDPENGPARWDCSHGHAERAEEQAFFEEMASHPDDCPCEYCEMDRELEAQWRKDVEACAARPGGHRWINALDGDGESGPLGVEIVCGDCHASEEVA